MVTLAIPRQSGHLKGLVRKREARCERPGWVRTRSDVANALYGHFFLGLVLLRRKTGGRLRRNREAPRPTPWAEAEGLAFGQNKP